MIPKKKEQYTENTQLPLPIDRGYVGRVADLNVFEELFLEEGKLTVVMCCDFEHLHLKIPYRYYLYESDKNSVIIYFGRKRVG